jgi:hypothetical protein
MLNYLLVTNILLLIIVVVLTYKWYTQRTYNRKLFIRSWALERTLMEIYEDCTVIGREKIHTTLDSIIPL